MAVVLVFSRARLLSVRTSSFVHSRRFTAFFAIYLSLHQSCGHVSGAAGARYPAPFWPLWPFLQLGYSNSRHPHAETGSAFHPASPPPTPVKFPSRGPEPNNSDATVTAAQNTPPPDRDQTPSRLASYFLCYNSREGATCCEICERGPRASGPPPLKGSRGWARPGSPLRWVLPITWRRS